MDLKFIGFSQVLSTIVQQPVDNICCENQMFLLRSAVLPVKTDGKLAVLMVIFCLQDDALINAKLETLHLTTTNTANVDLE